MREYKRRRRHKGSPPPKKGRNFDKLLFLAPYVYGRPLPKPAPDVVMPCQPLPSPDDVIVPSQLLETVYDEDDCSERRSATKSPTVTASGNPEDCEGDSYALKSMTIKIPEKSTSSKNAMRSMTSDGEKLVSSRIPEDSANKRETMTSRSPVVSNATATGISIAQSSKHDGMPMHCDERYQDKLGNKAFLLSFVPIMDTLPLHLSLQARMRIPDLFNDLLYQAFHPNQCACCVQTRTSDMNSRPPAQARVQPKNHGKTL